VQLAKAIDAGVMKSTGNIEACVQRVESSFGDGDELITSASAGRRKTDGAEWLAELLGCGLVRGSFIPPLGCSDLTRQRTAQFEGTPV